MCGSRISAVELVGEVVVVADRLPVAGQAVQPSPDPGLGASAGAGGSPSPPISRAVRSRVARVEGVGRIAAQPALADHVPDVGQRRVEVALDVDLAGDVGLRRPELARVPEQPAQHVGRVQAYGGRAVGPGDGAVPGGQPHGQVAADERTQRGLEPLGDARSGRPVAAGRISVVRHAVSSRAKVICWTSMYCEAKPARQYSR